MMACLRQGRAPFLPATWPPCVLALRWRSAEALWILGPRFPIRETKSQDLALGGTRSGGLGGRGCARRRRGRRGRGAGRRERGRYLGHRTSGHLGEGELLVRVPAAGLRLERAVVTAGRDRLDDVHALHDLAEQRVVALQLAVVVDE